IERAAWGRPYQRRTAGGERRHHDLTASGLQHTGISSVFLKQTPFDTDPQRSHGLVVAAIGNQQRPCGRCFDGEQGKNDEQAAGKQQTQRQHHWAIPFDMILGCYYHTKLRLHSPDGYSATPLQELSIYRPLTRIAMLGIRSRSL